jgi:hypothetical protein
MALVLSLGPGWAKYEHVLKNAPNDLIGRPRTEFLARARSAGLREARNRLPSAAGGYWRGNARKSITGRYDQRRGTVVIQSRMRADRVQSIEQGGGRFRLFPLARWAFAVKHPAVTGLIPMPAAAKRLPQWGDNWPQWRSLVDMVAARQPAKAMFAHTHEYWRRRLPTYLQEVATKMEARWARAA